MRHVAVRRVCYACHVAGAFDALRLRVFRRCYCRFDARHACCVSPRHATQAAADADDAAAIDFAAYCFRFCIDIAAFADRYYATAATIFCRRYAAACYLMMLSERDALMPPRFCQRRCVDARDSAMLRMPRYAHTRTAHARVVRFVAAAMRAAYAAEADGEHGAKDARMLLRSTTLRGDIRVIADVDMMSRAMLTLRCRTPPPSMHAAFAAALRVRMSMTPRASVAALLTTLFRCCFALCVIIYAPRLFI